MDSALRLKAQAKFAGRINPQSMKSEGGIPVCFGEMYPYLEWDLVHSPENVDRNWRQIAWLKNWSQAELSAIKISRYSLNDCLEFMA